MQQRPLFWSRDPSLQERRGIFAHQAHDGHAFGFIHLESVRLERAQDTLQVMDGFETLGNRSDDPSEVDVVCIYDDVRLNPLQVIPS